MNAVYCSGVLPTGTAPCDVSRSRRSGELRARTISPCSRSTMAPGVFAGADTPYQLVTSYPGIPLSATVGIFGTAGERLAPVTASARSLPPRTYWITVGRLPNISEVWPASSSTAAGPPPLYGTCTHLTPAMYWNSSPERWTVVPVPEDAKLISPGRRLENAISSSTFQIGNAGCTRSEERRGGQECRCR